MPHCCPLSWSPSLSMLLLHALVLLVTGRKFALVPILKSSIVALHTPEIALSLYILCSGIHTPGISTSVKQTEDLIVSESGFSPFLTFHSAPFSERFLRESTPNPHLPFSSPPPPTQSFSVRTDAPYHRSTPPGEGSNRSGTRSSGPGRGEEHSFFSTTAFSRQVAFSIHTSAIAR